MFFQETCRKQNVNGIVIRRIFMVLMMITIAIQNGCETFNRSAMKNSEGVAHYTQGQYDQALPYFQEAVKMDPNNAEAYYNIASTYQQQAIMHSQPGLLVQAENYYRACLDRNPSGETTVCCYRGLATVMSRRNQQEQAIALLKGWESRNPASIEPKLEIAYLQESLGKNKDAIATLKNAVTVAPGDYRPYYKLGVLEQREGSEADALNHLLVAGRINPSDREIANRISALQAKPNLMNATNTMNASQGTTTNDTATAKSSPSNMTNSNWQSVSTTHTGPTNATAPPVSAANTNTTASANTQPKLNEPSPTVSIVPPTFGKGDALPTPTKNSSVIAGNSAPGTTSQIPITSSIKKSETAPSYTNQAQGSLPANSAPGSTVPSNNKGPVLPDGTGKAPAVVTQNKTQSPPVSGQPAAQPAVLPTAQPAAQNKTSAPFPSVNTAPAAQLPVPGNTASPATGTNGAGITQPSTTTVPPISSARKSSGSTIGNGPPVTRVGAAF